MLLAVGTVMLTARVLLPLPAIPGVGERWAAVIDVLVWSVPYVGLVGSGAWMLCLSTDEREQLASFFGSLGRRSRDRVEREAPAVIVVGSADDPVVEAAAVVGRVEAMSVPAARQYLSSSAAARLVVVLKADGDPFALWSWTHEQRPDIERVLAFVGGREHPLYAEHGIRHYPRSPTAKVLRADWMKPEAEHEPE